MNENDEITEPGFFNHLRNEWSAVMIALIRAYRRQDDFVSSGQGTEEEQIAKAPYLLEERTASAPQANLLILVAPTGVGKTTIGRGLEEAGFVREARVTTRHMRPGEVAGRDYEFIGEDEFGALADEGAFFHVSAPTHTQIKEKLAEGHRVAVRWATVERLRRGERAYLEGGPTTARELKGLLAKEDIEAQLVVILPPSFEEWHSRLFGRVAAERAIQGQGDASMGSLTDEQVQGRMRRGILLLMESGEYADRFVVNDDPARVVRVLAGISS